MFSPEEQQQLQALKGIGPTLLVRLAQMGLDDVAALAGAQTETVLQAGAALTGSACWRNSPQARQAIQTAIDWAQQQRAGAKLKQSEQSSSPTTMSPYFELFQLPPQFDLDAQLLTQRYHTLAAQCHPDKFAHRSSFEQKQAMMMAATVNEAYRVLQEPLDRAAYLLQQQGIDADAPEHTHFAPAFLMQQMDWRERLADACGAHDEDALAHLDTEINDGLSALYRHLAAAFAENQGDAAAELVRQGRFLHKLRQEIRSALR